MKLKPLPLILATITLVVSSSAQDAVPERADVDEKYKWDLSGMYESDDAWEADMTRLNEAIPRAATYSGRLDESGVVLLEAIRFSETLRQLAGDLYVFAGLKFFEDQRVSKYGGMFSKARAASARVSEGLAFFRPELLAIPNERLAELIASTDGLAMYDHYFDRALRMRPYTLSEDHERLLAQASDPLSKFESVFSAIDNADLSFGTMRNEQGEEVELTKARYSSFLTSTDRRVREDAWIGLFESYEELGNTLAANYEGHLKGKAFFARARGYDSALQATLYPDAIPVSVYTNLIETVRENVGPLQRFLDIRREALGVDTLEVWDLYAPIQEPVWADLSFEEAKDIVARGLAPLGDEYIELYYRGFEERWADVLENRGKRGGAYSWGTYRSLPYFSMNFDGTLQDVFTLAHEYGHSLHSWFTRQTQPYTYGDYSLFVAEVASMTNEALLINKMLRETTDRAERLSLLQEYLDRFRGAFFRQVSFADFEMQAHALVEDGQPLTKDALRELYADVFRAYYGDAVRAHELNASEWSRIPHFLRSSNYYVYQYATSFAAATALAKRILEEGEPAAEQFIELLRSGGSDYPINLIKKAGVDMTTPGPILDTIAVFEDLLEQLETALAEGGKEPADTSG